MHIGSFEVVEFSWLVESDVSSRRNKISDLGVEVDDTLVNRLMTGLEPVVDPFVIFTEFVAPVREDKGTCLEEEIPSILPITHNCGSILTALPQLVPGSCSICTLCVTLR